MSQESDILNLTVEIVASYTGNNSIPASEVAGLVASVHAALVRLNRSVENVERKEGPAPATTKRKSLADPNVLISMIDGQPYRVLTRHIKNHGYTPRSYRETFGLPADYPMTAPNYSAKRSDLARTTGLGRKSNVSPEAVEPAQTPRTLQTALGKAKEHLGG